MNYVDYRFSLDVQEIGSQVFLTVKQGDTNRRLIINLTEGHEPYTIVEGCTAVLAGTKADGNVIFNNAVVEGNNIIYDFTEQTVAAVGSMKCEVRLYMEGRKLCSPNFTISVLPDAVGDAQIESLTEVNTLTGLINEATALIEDVNSDLESGAFVPELEIGIVETLPTGANATASITGSGKNLVLNLGLPRGPIGTADGLVVDAVLSKDSTNPIQNRAVAEEFETVRAEQQEYAQGVAEAFVIVGENLDDKVDKAAGKGLSTNDFTTVEKNKLAGIEAGANNFVLEDGAVTYSKLAADSKSKGVAVTLPSSGWTDNAQTVAVAGVTADNNVFVGPAPASREAWNDAEIYCSAQGNGTLTFTCGSAPAEAVTANVVILI